MFYVPYAFRRQTTYCIPKGPSIKWAPWLSFSVNGTKIELKVPRHKSRSPMNTQSPMRNYELSKQLFDDYRTNKNCWQSLGVIARGWDFNGAWFVGTRALMDMHAVIITPKETNKNVSFFHPRAFESGIADFMTYLYGSDVSVENNTQDWFAPMNWRPLLTHPCIAVCLDALENREVASDRIDKFLFVPLTNQHMLMIKFPVSRNNCYINSSTEPESDKDKWISNEPMEQLATDIINSLQITLSPEAKQQQEQALAGLTETSLISEFPPLKWV